MWTKYRSTRAHEAGFTLIEIMIVTAIIGILAAIAVPNFMSYRNKSRVSTVIATANVIRAALANFAADSKGNLYPSSEVITNDYDSLQDFVDANGGTLPETDLFSLDRYTTTGDNYSMRITVSNVPPTTKGHQILIAPSGILRCGVPTPADCD